MVIGRAQDMVGVALFSRASGLVELFNRTVLRAVTPVCMPYFAQSNRQTGSTISGYLMSVSYLTVIGWPFLAFMGIVAYAAIRIVYGSQWMASVPLAQILCAAGAIELIHYLAKDVLISVGDVNVAAFCNSFFRDGASQDSSRSFPLVSSALAGDFLPQRCSVRLIRSGVFHAPLGCELARW